MGRPRAVTETGRRVVRAFTERNVTLMAAGIAYSALVSLAPLLILLLLVVSLFGGGLERRLIAAADGSLPDPIADLVVQIMTAGAGTTGASLIGLLVLLWGTLKIFRGLDTAFSVIYRTDSDNSIMDQVIDGLVVFVALVLATVATVAVNALFLSLAERVPVVRFLAPLVLVAGLVVAFLPMYHRFPDTSLTWRSVLPGTVFAAVGWAALQTVFQVYLALRGGSSESFFGGLLVVVTWLYFSGLVVLLGALLNAVLSERPVGEADESTEGALPTVTQTTAHRQFDRAALVEYLGAWQARFEGERDASPAAAARSAPPPDATEAALLPTEGDPRPAETETIEVLERTGREDGRQFEAITVRWVPPADGET